MLGKNPTALARPTEPATGPLVESFALAEIATQLTWSDTTARLHHLRESGGLQIDGLLETPDGRVVAVEVKATTVPRAADAAPMAILRDRLDRLGDDFVTVRCRTGQVGDNRCGDGIHPRIWEPMAYPRATGLILQERRTVLMPGGTLAPTPASTSAVDGSAVAGSSPIDEWLCPVAAAVVEPAAALARRAQRAVPADEPEGAALLPPRRARGGRHPRQPAR